MSDLREKILKTIRRSNSSGMNPADQIISIVLDEVIEAVNKMESWTDKYEAMDVIESLKEKDK